MRTLLICTVMMCALTTAGMGAETIFSADFAGQTTAEGWQFANQRGQASGEFDATEPPEQPGSIRCDIPADNSARTTWVAPRIELKPNTAYRLRFRVMLGDIGNGSRGAYVILYENHVQDAEHWHMTPYMRGSRDWHDREIVFITREDTTWGRLECKLWGVTGHAWFDDIVLEEISRDELQLEDARGGRLVLPEDDGFALQTIFYPAHRRADSTMHLLPERLNPIAMFPYGRPDEIAEPAIVIEAPEGVTVSGPVVTGREPLPEPIEVTPEAVQRDGQAYLRWRLPIREETLRTGLKPDGPNWTRYHFVYALPAEGCPQQFQLYWRFENAGEQGPEHTIAAALVPNEGPNIEPVDGFELYAQHSDALRLPTSEGRNALLDYLFYSGIRGGLALSYYQPELRPIDDEMGERGWFTWTWRWYGYGGEPAEGQEIVYESESARRRGTVCPQVQVEMLEPHATWLREFYANALAIERGWLIMNYEPPVFSVCFCERCRREFARQSGLNVDDVLAMTPQEIQALPDHAWGGFRAWQNERIIKNHAAVIREIDPDCLFGVCGPPWNQWTADRGQDIRRFEPDVGLHAPMIYRDPADFEPQIRATCENTNALVMPFTLGSDIAVPATFPDAWDQWANMMATALSGGDGVILWVGIESLDGEIMNSLRHSMEQIRVLRPYIDGAERGAGVTIAAEVRNLRTVTVGDREIEVGSENSQIPVRDWQWSGPRGRMLALINYDREASHLVRIEAPGIEGAQALLGPAGAMEGDALVIDLAPGELAAVAWE